MAEIEGQSFSRFGITWKVRKPIGITYSFVDLAALQQALSDGRIDTNDELSWDERDWRRISEIPSLPNWFSEVWARAESKGMKPQHLEIDEEELADAPTTVIRSGSSLSDEIRRALEDSSTPIHLPPMPVKLPSTRTSNIGDIPIPTSPTPVVEKQTTPLLYMGIGLLLLVTLAAAIYFSGIL